MTRVWRRRPKPEARRGGAIGWIEDRRGVSAVEFSLVAPVLIVVFMGLSDLATASLAQLHVNHAAQGTADAVASEQTLQTSDMVNMLTAASYFMTPYASAPLSVRVTNIYYDGVPSHAYGLVYWSCALNGASSTTTYTPYTYKQQFNYVPGMAQQSATAIYWVLWTGNAPSIGTSVVVVETSYSFTSPSNFIIQGTHVISSAYVTVPRVANYVGFPYSATTTLKPPQSTTTANAVTLSDGATCNYGS